MSKNRFYDKDLFLLLKPVLAVKTATLVKHALVVKAVFRKNRF